MGRYSFYLANFPNQGSDSVGLRFIYKSSFFYENILFYEKNMLQSLMLTKQSHYYIKNIPKKGGVRQLNCLIPGELSVIQDNLKNNFLNFISVPNYVFGFIKGGSYKEYLVPHCKKKYYLRIDIKNFFDAIKIKDLEDCFRYYFKVAEKEKDDLLKDLLEIITFNDKVPQGAITSPIVSNIVFRQLDIRIFEYCRKHSVKYTRYADDMMFSSNTEYVIKPHFTKMISKILSTKSFEINISKLRKSSNFISINGFVVGKDITFSRKRRKDINNVIFIYNSLPKPLNKKQFIDYLNKDYFYYRTKVGDLYFSNNESLINYLAGYRSFIIGWLTHQEGYDDKILKDTIKKIESMIDCLCK